MAKHLTENKSVNLEAEGQTGNKKLIEFDFPLEHETIQAENLEEAKAKLERKKQTKRSQDNNINQEN